MSHDVEFEIDLAADAGPAVSEHALGWGLAWRQIRGSLRADAVPLLLVAILVFAASVTAAAGPARLAALADRALRQNVAAAALDDRSLTVSATVTDTAESGVAFAAMESQVGKVLPPAAATVLTGVSHTYRAFAVPAGGPAIPEPGGLPARMTLVDDTRTGRLVHFVEGTPPDAATVPAHRVALGLSRRASADLHLSVGATVELGDPPGDPADGTRHPVIGVVTGIFDATPAAGLDTDDAAFFAQNQELFQPQLSTLGNTGSRYWAGGLLVSDAGLATLAHATMGVQIEADWRRTADPAALSAGAVGPVAAAITRFERTAMAELCQPYQWQLASCRGLASPLGSQRTTTGLPALFDTFQARHRSASALESFGVAALIAVELAAVFAAARLVASRRARAIGLQRARGASRRQAATLVAIESALVIVPATVLGRVVGGAGGAGDASGRLWPSVTVAVFGVAVIPAMVLIKAAPGAVRGRGGAPVLPAAKRRTLEALLAILAIVTVVSLRGRGVGGTTTGGSVDPVMAATPVLLGALTAVLVIKALPRPTAIVTRLAGRSRATAAWLGLARAAERGQTLAVALAVLVMTLAGAVFSGVVVKTLTHGETAAADRLGADAVVRAPALGADALDRLQALPGDRLEPVTAFDRATVDDDGSAHVVRFVGVGPAIVPGLPASADPDGTLPVLASPSAARQYPDGAFTVGMSGGDVDLRIAGVLPQEPAGPIRAALDDPAAPYVVLPAAVLARTAAATSPGVAALYGPVTSDQIRAALAGVAPSADIRVRAEQLQAMRTDGLSRSLTGVFEVCAGLSAAFAVLVVVLELTGTARERGKTVSFLRTMGLPARSAAAVVEISASMANW